MTPLPPIRREIVVAAPPDVAFSVFTDGIGRWWPLPELSVHGARADVAFTDGRLIESAPGCPDALWGTVLEWSPPTGLAFTWHPGHAPERAGRVDVRFTAVTEGTLVRLEHSGWERFADPAAARAEYEHGWPQVLDAYAAAAAPAEPEWTWVVLEHRPGPASDGGATVFADPRFADHVAFLRRMAAAGRLVAAGPLADAPGSGLTVLRLPGADRLAEARELATTDDESVASGFFEVTVRPWDVVMAG